MNKRVISVCCICLGILLVSLFVLHKFGYRLKDDTLPPWHSITAKSENTFSFERQVGLKSGKLLYTVANPRLITDIHDLPDSSIDAINNGFSHYDNFYFPKLNKFINFPDFIKDDGAFISGCYLLLFDITVESKDATNYTNKDVAEDGIPFSDLDSDPYIFFADDIVVLANDIQPDENTNYVSATFFSDFGKHSDRGFTYRLEPNQRTNFSIGFGITDSSSGGIFDYDKISLLSACANNAKLGELCISANDQIIFKFEDMIGDTNDSK